MIAIEIDSQRTTSSDTSDVEICTAPAATKRRAVVAIRFTNLDNINHTVVLKKKIGGVTVDVETVAGVPATVCEKSWCSEGQPFILKPTESLVGALGETATTECSWLVEFQETTD